MIGTARLWSGLGLAGLLSGNSSLGASAVEAYSCELRRDPARNETMAQTAARWAGTSPDAGALLSAWQARDPERLYFLEVPYHDVFGVAAGKLVLRAWFDPEGRGRWRTYGTLAYPSASVSLGTGPQGQIAAGALEISGVDE
jgi:hypothetical protein